ncbi:MAG: chromosomal replication initiator protein DnaA [Bacteroidetes bacterium]|jgi:chromosomal replication initiator protein|nr:chromosomal replication initiator protein DnaA [Phycisphaerae bacterium]NBB74551.1 chromosomal replication initiator protein DnaA [Bacteroidota bacterium]
MKTSTEPLRADDGLLRQILATLQDRIGPQKFNAWFRHGTDVSLEDGHVKVAVPNPFVANWIEHHYQSDIAEAVNDHVGKMPGVCITVDASLSGRCRKRVLDMQAELVSRTTQGRTRGTRAIDTVDCKHTLEDFVVGACNKLAYGAAMALTRDRQTPFTQLFVHGPCGVGKTHLLQGVCNQLAASGNGSGTLRWRYVTGEQFTNEFVAALRNKQAHDFRRRYRKLDLLAIDDVHFLAAKRATQDEFLHTFNAIESAGKRIVLASDAHPRMVGDLNEQLVSRFMSGMVVKIDAPDHDTRVEILRQKTIGLGMEMSDEVVEYVAMHIRGSVRELEGTLIKLSALAGLEDGGVTLDLARDALAEHLARTDGAVTLGDIEAVVATFFGITPADIHSSRRTRTVSTARMIAMHLARRYTRMSFPEIGRFMGKNHSSVVLACQRMDKHLAEAGELEWTTPAGTKAMPAEKLLSMIDEQIH